jgi:ABC-type transporter MlaC component
VAQTADYAVAYATPEPISPQAWRVRVEIRSARDPREPARDIDYVVRRGAVQLRVVDILTEGASLTESCKREFAKLLTDQKDGYAALLQHLKDAAVATAAF